CPTTVQTLIRSGGGATDDAAAGRSAALSADGPSSAFRHPPPKTSSETRRHEARGFADKVDLIAPASRFLPQGSTRAPGAPRRCRGMTFDLETFGLPQCPLIASFTSSGLGPLPSRLVKSFRWDSK